MATATFKKMRKEEQIEVLETLKANDPKRWSWKRVLMDPLHAPNIAIERILFSGGMVNVGYGKKKKLDDGVMDWLRCELARRNRHGEFIFGSRRERRKLRPVKSVYAV